MSLEKPFTHLTASGNGEVYDQGNANKFQQFGWRCTTNETGFKSDTLIGNWNEERYDVRYLSKNKPINSQYSHYFATTHGIDFKSDKKTEELPSHVKLFGGKQSEPRTFPRHQPELDHPAFKRHYNKFESTSMAAYKNPYK